ncbi:MAG TPA: Uma2 family endonuclease [Thermomicrobiales bacterium]|nr:Uma2 family endonuclease [Thermomicrobiales bacterium]
MVATKLMTIEELEALPEDGRKHELLWGELISVAPNFRHVKITGIIIELLAPHVRQRGLGVVGPEGSFMFSRDPDLLLIPDVVFVSTDRVPPEEEQSGYITVIPNMVFEVISPSETARTVHAKVMAYLDMGVSMVVVVHPERQDVTVWDDHRTARVLSAGDDLAFGDVLPGFHLPVADLFG